MLWWIPRQTVPGLCIVSLSVPFYRRGVSNRYAMRTSAGMQSRGGGTAPARKDRLTRDASPYTFLQFFPKLRFEDTIYPTAAASSTTGHAREEARSLCGVWSSPLTRQPMNALLARSLGRLKDELSATHHRSKLLLSIAEASGTFWSRMNMNSMHVLPAAA